MKSSTYYRPKPSPKEMPVPPYCARNARGWASVTDARGEVLITCKRRTAGIMAGLLNELYC
jgi:hypothetical protein